MSRFIIRMQIKITKYNCRLLVIMKFLFIKVLIKSMMDLYSQSINKNLPIKINSTNFQMKCRDNQRFNMILKKSKKNLHLKMNCSLLQARIFKNILRRMESLRLETQVLKKFSMKNFISILNLILSKMILKIK